MLKKLFVPHLIYMFSPLLMELSPSRPSKFRKIILISKMREIFKNKYFRLARSNLFMNFAAFLCGCLTKVLRVHIFLCCITWGDMLESWTNIQLRPTDGHKTAPKKMTTYICILKFAWSYGVQTSYWERGNSIDGFVRSSLPPLSFEDLRSQSMCMSVFLLSIFRSSTYILNLNYLSESGIRNLKINFYI